LLQKPKQTNSRQLQPFCTFSDLSAPQEKTKTQTEHQTDAKTQSVKSIRGIEEKSHVKTKQKRILRNSANHKTRRAEKPRTEKQTLQHPKQQPEPKQKGFLGESRVIQVSSTTHRLKDAT